MKARTIKKSNKEENTNQNSEGFTLIEMITLVAITAILSTFIVFNVREGERGLALNRSAEVTTQTITKAINNALGGKKHPDAGGNTETVYGITLSANEGFVTLFADCNTNNEYDENGTNSTCAGGVSEKVEERNLEDDMEFASIANLGTCSDPQSATVLFLSPDPTVNFFNPDSGTNCDVDEAEFIIEDTRSGETVSVFVNSIGVTRIE